MHIDVVDVLGVEPRLFQGHSHAASGSCSLGIWGGHVIGVGSETVA